MSVIVPRTCTEISTRNVDQNREENSRLLKEFRSASAYVLIGDPGSGKTTAFETESMGEVNTCLISARNFLSLDMNSHPEWRSKTLFIDGLDEVRVGVTNRSTPLDRIRRRIDALGKPRFRLSCREADWLGNKDLKHLSDVSPDSAVMVLRLDVLTDSNIARILMGHPAGIGDAEAFIASAREWGVGGLLGNPLSLDMLADVVARNGGWPESRMETFEKACLLMVHESNEDHSFGERQLAPDELLNAAGRLCAIQLLSGAVGYTRGRGLSEENYPRLDQCDYYPPEVLQLASATKLFRGESNNCFVPVHRHIAEFLGARHLAKIIGAGLPARRVLAMITGEDGAVATEMRGLSAWLGALCKDVRQDLIERDPIGIGLYGDIRAFSLDEKQSLLKALNREGPRLGSVWRTAKAFGPLATTDMESVLKKILNDSSRNRDQQVFTAFVLGVLNQGTPLSNLSGILLEMVRDETRWPHINTLALDALIHCDHSQDKTSKLKALLADIRRGSLSDPDSELLGTLLTALYPQELPPSEVWNYLSETGNPELIGRCFRFWYTSLSEKSTPGHEAKLLDSLTEGFPHLISALDARYLNRLPFKLLDYGLQACGDQLDMGRLYDWLSVGSLERKKNYEGDEPIRSIRSWLEQRPEAQKKIILEGLDRCPETDEFRSHAFDIHERLYGADRPADFGLWCLEQACAMAGTRPRAAEHLLEEAFWAQKNQNGNDGLSIALLQKHAETHEILKKRLDLLNSPRRISSEYLERDRKYAEERCQQEDQWLNHVRSNEAALRENRAAPALLDRMAQAYFGQFYNLNVDGPKGIEKLLKGDAGLIDAALQGLRGSIHREDVPDIGEILDLREKGSRHYIGWPFLAGLAEVERLAPEDPSRWDTARIRKALTFYYCTPHADYRPHWYRRLLEACPEIVADVQVRFAVSEFRSERESIYKLWELAHDPEHAQVAQHASLPLLHAFPTRCRLKQLHALDSLLWAAIQHADRALLQELIERKLSRKSLNVAQRVYWLAAGALVSPKAYKDPLRDFLEGQQSRIRHLPVFLCNDDPVRFSFHELNIPLLELLIRLIGSYAGPNQWSEDGWVTPVMEASSLVDKLIQCIAASPDQLATAALDTLHTDPALADWRDVLSKAQDAQRVIRRDASYRHYNIEQVCRTLNDDTPANAGDLVALVMDRLCDLGNRIRTGNTNDWRQYWNEDAHGRPCAPKHEHSCRNALLSDLRELLPQGVDAQPEGQYANETRADIRVSCRDFQIPVEVKRSGNPKLWSALKNQLIKLYTREPATNGYGIYLVFWFGKDHMQPPPSGTRPDNTQVLREQLAETLSEDEARKISVCVIDASRDLTE